MIRLFIFIFVLLFVACDNNSSQNQTNETINSPKTLTIEKSFNSLSVAIAVPTKNLQSNDSKHLHKPLGIFSDIDKVLLLIQDENGNNLVENHSLLYINGQYQGEIPNLPLNIRLNIVVSAYNETSLEIFRGSQETVLVNNQSNQISIVVHNLDDGEDITIPRLTRVLSDKEQLHFYIDDNGSTSTLQYTILSGDESVVFNHISGTVTLIDGAYVLDIDYNASEYGSFIHQFSVENNLGGKLSTNFTTTFADTEGDSNLSVSLAPVISGIHIIRNGDGLIVDSNISDDSDIETLSYEYQFETLINGGLEQRFIDPLVNPALLDGYNENVMGYIHIKVSDQSGANSQSSFLIRQNQFPDFTPPLLINHNPLVDGINIDINSPIHITFDEIVSNVNDQTLIFTPEIAVDITTNDNKSFTLTPIQALQFNTSYTLVLTKAIIDGSDNAFIGYNFSFSTQDNSNDDNVAPIPTFVSLSLNKNSDTQTLLSAIDSDGDNLTFIQVSDPEHGQLQLQENGVINYIPQTNYIGSDSFKYKVNDGKVDSYHQKVAIHVGVDELNISIPTLLLRIEFNDISFTHNESVWENKIFGNEQSELNHYFQSVSYNNFSLSNRGIHTITLNKNHPDNSQEAFLAELANALNQVDNQIDFSQFDINGDAYVSNKELLLMFVVAGGESSVGDTLGIWSHTWCFDQNSNGFSAPILDNVVIAQCGEGNYIRFGERQENHDATIGVMAHEVGHAVFNLDDLYDKTHNSAGIGLFGLMGHGLWAKAKSDDFVGQTPSAPSAYSKYLLNWGTMLNITHTPNDDSYLLNSTADKHYNFLKLDINNHSYYLIENRSALGYDKGLEALQGNYKGGLALWKVDMDNEDNSKVNHKRVDLIEANAVSLDNSNHLGHTNNLFYNPHKTSFKDDDNNIEFFNIGNRDEIMALSITKDAQ